MKKCYCRCLANITANKKKKIPSRFVESHNQLRSVWLAICMAIYKLMLMIQEICFDVKLVIYFDD